MRVTCPICRGPHAKWDCKATESTAARKERAEAAGGLQTAKSPNGVAIDDHLKPTEAKQQVTSAVDQPSQALPVDTNPGSSMGTLDSSTQTASSTPSAGTGEDADRQLIHSGVLKLVDSTGRCISAEIEGSNPSPTTKPRGRPRIHPDRKAYKAEHERKRRARKKESRNAE